MTTDARADDYVVRTELDAMDLDRIHGWLSTDAYWALGRTRDKVEAAARHSLNVGLFAVDGQQVAYARVVTDRANFAWLCDVYVDRDHAAAGWARGWSRRRSPSWSSGTWVACCSRRGTPTRSTHPSASSRFRVRRTG